MTTILRCPRCWRTCAGIRCPECAIGTALVDLADSIGAEAVAQQQHAAARSRKPAAIQLDLFGNTRQASPAEATLFDQSEGLL